MGKLAILGGSKIRTKSFPMESPQINQKDISGIIKVLRERRLSIFSSPKIHEFELDFAKYVGTNDAIAVTSGTAALHASLMAIGVGIGDEVIVPVYTHMSTINPILMQGATPIFVDVDQGSFNLDVNRVEERVSPKTKAIILVDLFGNPVARKGLMEICSTHNLILIEDCAQSLGAEIHKQRVGSFGIGCFSFGEIKNITSAEGGMITTNDPEIGRRIRILRHEGEIWGQMRSTTIGPGPILLIDMIHGIDYESIGQNYRMNALQATLGISQLSRIDEINSQRHDAGKFYTNSLEGISGLQLQSISVDAIPVYNRFVLLLSSDLKLSRDAFLAALISEGVPAGVYYPKPLNQARIFTSLENSLKNDESNNPNNLFAGARHVCDQQILLPCYPGLKVNDLKDVVAAMKKVIDAVSNSAVAEDVERKAKQIEAQYFGQFFTVNS